MSLDRDERKEDQIFRFSVDGTPMAPFATCPNII